MPGSPPGSRLARRDGRGHLSIAAGSLPVSVTVNGCPYPEYASVARPSSTPRHRAPRTTQRTHARTWTPDAPRTNAGHNGRARRAASVWRAWRVRCVRGQMARRGGRRPSGVLRRGRGAHSIGQGWPVAGVAGVASGTVQASAYAGPKCTAGSIQLASALCNPISIRLRFIPQAYIFPYSGRVIVHTVRRVRTILLDESIPMCDISI